MNTNREQLQTDITKAVTQLRTLRDEARVKIHLASMDARDAWDKLQPKLLEAEQAAEKASKETLDTIEATAKKLSELLRSL
jgi:hypothetical protein